MIKSYYSHFSCCRQIQHNQILVAQAFVVQYRYQREIVAKFQLIIEQYDCLRLHLKAFEIKVWVDPAKRSTGTVTLRNQSTIFSTTQMIYRPFDLVQSHAKLKKRRRRRREPSSSQNVTARLHSYLTPHVTQAKATQSPAGRDKAGNTPQQLTTLCRSVPITTVT